jgi:hypothetical protein
VTVVLRSIPKEAFADSFQKFNEFAKSVLWRMAIILKANKVNLFVSSVLFVFWYHSPNYLDTPLTLNAYAMWDPSSEAKDLHVRLKHEPFSK